MHKCLDIVITFNPTCNEAPFTLAIQYDCVSLVDRLVDNRFGLDFFFTVLFGQTGAVTCEFAACLQECRSGGFLCIASVLVCECVRECLFVSSVCLNQLRFKRRDPFSREI